MLAILLAVCPVPSFCAQQDKPPVSEVFSLQHLIGNDPGQATPPWGSLLRRMEQPQCDMLGAAEPTEGFSADDAIGLLRELESDALENARLEVIGVGDSLVAAGDPAVVARLREHVKAATQLLARPLQIEFAVWDGTDRETPAAFLGPADFGRFAANRTPLWRSIATTRHGRAVALERMRWSRYVRDIDVEIAQKQTMSYPVTNQHADGGHAVVRPHLLTGSDEVVLHVQFAVAQRRGVVRSLQTGMTGASDIDLPALETAYGVCSGRVPNGGALAVTLRGNPATGGQLVLTVRVTGRTPPAGAPMQDLGLYPCGAITTQALLQSVEPPPDRDPDEVSPGESHEGFGHLPEDILVQFLRAGLGADGDADGVSVRCKAGYVVVRGPTQLLAKVETLMRGLQDRLLRNATVVHRAPMSTADASGAPGTSMLHELALPTLLGRELIVARCLETNIVADIFAEIAQEAGILNPKIDVLQSGSWLRARLSPLGDAMSVRLLVQDRYAPLPTARSVMPGGGVLMPTEAGKSLAAHDGIVANGQAIEHGDGPAVNLEGRAWRSSLATTIQW